MVESVDPVNRWTSRIIPLILVALVVIACYVVTGRICVNILIQRGETGAAIAFLVLLYSSLILMAICFARTLGRIYRNPGVVPLGPGAVPQKVDRGRARAKEEHSYDASPAAEEARSDASDGLKDFYSKDVFVCEEDGRPRWCSTCRNWKPDRSHHSKELGRCVRKMDHYCPWAGGIISETSFKFFVQFCAYAALFCTICLCATAYIINMEIKEGTDIDVWVAVILGISAFFGLFTCTMATNSMRFAYLNLSTIDIIDYQIRTYYLAIRVAHGTAPGYDYKLITFPRSEALGSNQTTSEQHTFAIVQTMQGDNPWDLGRFKNWKSIMGDTWIDWLLPLRGSPETDYDSSVSEYPLGSVYPRLRERYGLPAPEQQTEERKKRRRRKSRSQH